MEGQKRAGRVTVLTCAGLVYLSATPILVLAIYAPLLIEQADLFRYLNEALYVWMAMFLAPFAVIDRALAGWRSLRVTDARCARR